jgi:hypothetical protein
MTCQLTIHLSTQNCPLNLECFTSRVRFDTKNQILPTDTILRLISLVCIKYFKPSKVKNMKIMLHRHWNCLKSMVHISSHTDIHSFLSHTHDLITKGILSKCNTLGTQILLSTYISHNECCVDVITPPL